MEGGGANRGRALKKKLLPCTDSTVVETLKVLDEVAIETGFHCTTNLKEQ